MKETIVNNQIVCDKEFFLWVNKGGVGWKGWGVGPLIWYSCIDRKLDVIFYFVMHGIESLDMRQLHRDLVFSFIATAVCDFTCSFIFLLMEVLEKLCFFNLLKKIAKPSFMWLLLKYKLLYYFLLHNAFSKKNIFLEVMTLGWNFGVNILWWNTNLIHTLFCVQSLSFISYYRQFFFKHQIPHQTL